MRCSLGSEKSPLLCRGDKQIMVLTFPSHRIPGAPSRVSQQPQVPVWRLPARAGLAAPEVTCQAHEGGHGERPAGGPWETGLWRRGRTVGTAMALAAALGRTSQVIRSPERGRPGRAGLRHVAAGRGELESERLPERAARGGETLGLGRTGLPGGPLDSGPQTHQPPRVPWGLGTLQGPTPSLAGCRACTYPSSHPRAAWKGQGRARHSVAWDPGPRHQPAPPSAHAHRRATPGASLHLTHSPVWDHVPTSHP